MQCSRNVSLSAVWFSVRSSAPEGGVSCKTIGDRPKFKHHHQGHQGRMAQTAQWISCCSTEPSKSASSARCLMSSLSSSEVEKVSLPLPCAASSNLCSPDTGRGRVSASGFLQRAAIPLCPRGATANGSFGAPTSAFLGKIGGSEGLWFSACALTTRWGAEQARWREADTAQACRFYHEL